VHEAIHVTRRYPQASSSKLQKIQHPRKFGHSVIHGHRIEYLFIYFLLEL
jgi:hypothetical protein